jgi:hypothetical protein
VLVLSTIEPQPRSAFLLAVNLSTTENDTRKQSSIFTEKGNVETSHKSSAATSTNSTTSVITARGESRTTIMTGLSSTGGGAGSISAEAAYRAGMLKTQMTVAQASQSSSRRNVGGNTKSPRR